jgi:hypothetical protein
VVAQVLELPDMKNLVLKRVPQKGYCILLIRVFFVQLCMVAQVLELLDERVECKRYSQVGLNSLNWV